jgi:PTS system nitrogen regulatory IIA component
MVPKVTRPSSTESRVKISDVLSPAHVMLDVRASDKDSLLQELSAQAAAALGIDAVAVSDQIAKREELGSTGVGHGVALPHARLKSLKAPFGLLARLRRPIDFAAIDEKPVDIVFLLLLPDAADSAQLNALACVARMLRDNDLLARIRGATEASSLFEEIAGTSAG